MSLNTAFFEFQSLKSSSIFSVNTAGESHRRQWGTSGVARNGASPVSRTLAMRHYHWLERPCRCHCHRWGLLRFATGEAL